MAIREYVVQWLFGFDDKQLKALDDRINSVNKDIEQVQHTANRSLAAVDARVGALRQRWSGLGENIRQASAQMQRTGAIITATVTTPLLLAGGSAFKAAAEMDSLTRALQTNNGSAEATREELARLKEVAKLPGLGFREAILGSVRLQGAGIAARLAERALMGFGNAIASAGGGKEQLDSVTLALSQIVGRGKVTADNINQIANAFPGVRKQMKLAFGTAASEDLQKMNLGAEEFITKLVAQLELMPRVTGGARNAMENLGDSLFRLNAAFGRILIRLKVPELMERLAVAAENLANTVDHLSPGMIKFLGIILAIVAAIGPLLLIFGTLGVALVNAVRLWGLLTMAAESFAVMLGGSLYKWLFLTEGGIWALVRASTALIARWLLLPVLLAGLVQELALFFGVLKLGPGGRSFFKDVLGLPNFNELNKKFDLVGKDSNIFEKMFSVTPLGLWVRAIRETYDLVKPIFMDFIDWFERLGIIESVKTGIGEAAAGFGQADAYLKGSNAASRPFLGGGASVSAPVSVTIQVNAAAGMTEAESRQVGQRAGGVLIDVLDQWWDAKKRELAESAAGGD